MHSEMSGNLGLYIVQWMDRFRSAFASAHTSSSEISSGIFFKMSASSGVQSLSSLVYSRYIL